MTGQQIEARYVNDWLTLNHPSALQWKRVRLGALPRKEFGNLFKVIQRWADAIFVEEGVVHIVEAKLAPDLRIIGQLLGYKDLFPETPEFSQFKELPIEMHALVPRSDPEFKRTVDNNGIILEVYNPLWLNKILSERQRKRERSFTQPTTRLTRS